MNTLLASNKEKKGKKIKLLFVIESLALAGSEKSLIALLSNLDADLYDIDLQLFNYGGELERFIPKHVTILKRLEFNKFASSSLTKNLKDTIFKRKFSFFRAKMSYSFSLRMKKRNHHEIAKMYWQKSNAAYDISMKEYDVAIAYAQGLPTFYVMDKIIAKKKITWVNANVDFEGTVKDYQEKYYRKFDAVVAVSDGTKVHQTNIFPQLKLKYRVINDIIDYKKMGEMAELYETPMSNDEFNILTVSRLVDGMKGMDIMIEVCKLLYDRGLKFHWYILGKGPFRDEMEVFFKKNNLEEVVTLIGTKNNPYPYYLAADLYVQTSRNESYGMSIAEARLLDLPVVTTRFDTVFTQMLDGKNGLVTDMNPEAVANAIERMMNDNDLYNAIVEYLKQEQKENLESVEKFDALIEELLGTI